MNNHVHFICMPLRKDSLAKVFSSVHMRYSQYYNKKLKAKRHLWQGRFYSCVLEHEHLYTAVRYVERNPVRAKLVNKAWNWEWSSAAFHVGETNNSKIELADISEIIKLEGTSWKEFIINKDDPRELDNIRKCTMLGRPYGGSEFIKNLAKILGINLISKGRGRPKREK